MVILYALAAIYVVGFSVAAIYQNVIFLINEGFLAWLFLGELIATFRAIDWPLDVYQALM